jgi:CheY-like chemotaxis protein
MDVQMPVLDGVAATRIIRDHEAREGRNRTPIIALTANVMSHQTDEYLQAGMDDAVAKPICAEDLMRAILTATAERRPRDGAAPGVEAAA